MNSLNTQLIVDIADILRLLVEPKSRRGGAPAFFSSGGHVEDHFVPLCLVASGFTVMPRIDEVETDNWGIGGEALTERRQRKKRWRRRNVDTTGLKANVPLACVKPVNYNRAHTAG